MHKKAVGSNIKPPCVFLDLSKAFGTVNYSKLLDSMQRILILYHHMVSYQRYPIRTYLKIAWAIELSAIQISDSYSTEYGVSQRTVLKPLTEVFHIQITGTIVSHADDTATLYKSTIWEDSRERYGQYKTFYTKLTENKIRYIYKLRQTAGKTAASRVKNCQNAGAALNWFILGSTRLYEKPAVNKQRAQSPQIYVTITTT